MRIDRHCSRSTSIQLEVPVREFYGADQGRLWQSWLETT